VGRKRSEKEDARQAGKTKSTKPDPNARKFTTETCPTCQQRVTKNLATGNRQRHYVSGTQNICSGSQT
jgi:hypothetical protein